MADSESVQRRRRRRRAPLPGPDAAPGATPHPDDTTGDQPPRDERRDATATQRPRRNRHGHHGDSAERILRDIVGAGRSQLGVNGALRARDVNRPTDEDLLEAEREVVIVRRNWTPPASR